jgi:hypothetical protein
VALAERWEGRGEYDASFGSADAKHWETFGSGKSTPEPKSFGAPWAGPPPPSGSGLSKTINKPFAGLDINSKRHVQSPVEDDLLAAFNSAAPVDKSTHFPIPSRDSVRSTPAMSANVSRGQTSLPQSGPSRNELLEDDDDDMFGLKQLAQKSISPAPIAVANATTDDDILGLLSKPVSEFQRTEQPGADPQETLATAEETSADFMNPHDKAVAELVDMGFPAERSAIALATTDSGLDVQAAVGWLLTQAHASSKQRTQGNSRDRSPRRNPDDQPRREGSRPGHRDVSREARAGGSRPAWMRDDEARSRSGQRKGDTPSQEKDVTQVASDIGSTLFKSANSLWKTGRKQVQKAMADLNQDGGDPNVPKWMRDAQAAEANPRSARSQRVEQSATDEAMMLEAGGRPSKQTSSSEKRQQIDSLPVRRRKEEHDRRGGQPDRMMSKSPLQRTQTPSLDKRPATRLTRQEVEEQSPQAYVSPARRKKTTPQPEVDLFAAEPEQPKRPIQHSKPSQSNNPFRSNICPPVQRSPYT